MTDAREGRHAVEGEQIAMVGGRERAMMGRREPGSSTWYLKPSYYFGARLRLLLFLTGLDKDLFGRFI